MSKVLNLKNWLINQLKSESEANLILFSILKKNYSLEKFSDLLNPNLTLTLAEEEAAKETAIKRMAGIPLQHLIQFQYFLNHEYFVNENVLIPRPETEVLLQEIFSRLRKQKINFAELGLGSGIISCEILAQYNKSFGVASELSIKAKAVAEKNLETIIGPSWKTNLKIIQPDHEKIGFEIFKEFAPFDLIVSNPPYVSGEDEIEDQVKSHEPHTALFPPVNPNYFYENFLLHASELLAPQGFGAFEIPHERAKEITALFHNHPNLKSELVNDLTGRPRVLITQLIK